MNPLRLCSVVILVAIFVITLYIGISVDNMLDKSETDKRMDSNPSYNGTWTFYWFVRAVQIAMGVLVIFGVAVACLALMNAVHAAIVMGWGIFLAINLFVGLILGIVGLVQFKQSNLESHVMSLFETFETNVHDKEFTTAFQEFQCENDCCGVKGPSDWKTLVQEMCPVQPNNQVGLPGCGEKLFEANRHTMTVYCSLLIVQAICTVLAPLSVTCINC